MIPSHFGDLSRHMATSRQTSILKRDLARLTQEMSSQKKADLPRALGARQERAAEIGQRMTRIDGYLENASQLSSRYEIKQTSLGLIDSTAQHLSEKLLINPDMMSAAEREMASGVAERSFETMVAALSVSFGGVNLFSGVKTDTQPLPDARSILSDLRAAVDFSGSAASIQADVEAFFEDDSGPFATTIYQGADAATTGVAVGDNRRSASDVTAVSKPIRKMLSGVALAALVGEGGIAADRSKQGEVLLAARNKMFARTDLIAMQAELGSEREYLESAQAALTAERASLTMETNNMTRADPYETASRLQQVQLQLETHFTITGRLSRLSLVNYLP